MSKNEKKKKKKKRKKKKPDKWKTSYINQIHLENTDKSKLNTKQNNIYQLLNCPAFIIVIWIFYLARSHSNSPQMLAASTYL